MYELQERAFGGELSFVKLYVGTDGRSGSPSAVARLEARGGVSPRPRREDLITDDADWFTSNGNCRPSLPLFYSLPHILLSSLIVTMSSSGTASTLNSRLGPGQIFSQPSLTGAGQKDNTILVSALDALKLHKSPVRLEDFALTHGLTRLVEDEVLRERFKGHPRVEWNAKLDLWMYKVNSERGWKGAFRTQTVRRLISSNAHPHLHRFSLSTTCAPLET